MSKFLKEGEGDFRLKQREGGEIIDEQLKGLLDEMRKTFTGKFNPESQPEEFRKHFSKILYGTKEEQGDNAFEEGGKKLLSHLKEIFKKENFERLIETIILALGLDKYSIMNIETIDIKSCILLQIFGKLNLIDKDLYKDFIQYLKESEKLPFISFSVFGKEGCGFVFGRMRYRSSEDFAVLSTDQEGTYYRLSKNQPYEIMEDDKDTEIIGKIIPIGEIYRNFWEKKEASKGGKKGTQASRMAAVNQEGLAETLESKLDIEGMIDQIWATDPKKWAEIIFPQMPMIFEEIKKNPKEFSERLLKKFNFVECLNNTILEDNSISLNNDLSVRTHSFVMILNLLGEFSRYSYDGGFDYLSIAFKDMNGLFFLEGNFIDFYIIFTKNNIDPKGEGENRYNSIIIDFNGGKNKFGIYYDPVFHSNKGNFDYILDHYSK